MKRVLLFTALLLAWGSANAAFYSTGYLRGLLNSCAALPGTFEASPENFTRIKDCGLSTGYILGVFDALDVIADRSKCIPETVQSEEVVVVVEKWLKNHPEQTTSPADKAIESAFNEAWSCRK